MNISLFGATGALGSELLRQLLAGGHQVEVLVRHPEKLPTDMAASITVVEGDGLEPDDVGKVIHDDTDAVMFAVGVDKNSPEQLCTRVTENILSAMAEHHVKRLVWCGGGSTFVEEDHITFGAQMVRKVAEAFMAPKHYDKEYQYQLFKQHAEIDWLGVRPLQMKHGEHTGNYRLGFDTFNGLSSISFADCADAMVNMLQDDTWLRKAPIIQY
jgi:putative NADH-flavin reductase